LSQDKIQYILHKMSGKTDYSNYDLDRLIKWIHDQKTAITNAIEELRIVETLLSHYPNKPIPVSYNSLIFQKIDVSNYMIINNEKQKTIQIKGDTTFDRQKNVALVSNAVIMEAKKIIAPYIDTVGFGTFQFKFEMMQYSVTDDRVLLRTKIKTAGEAAYLWNIFQQKVTNVELLLATALDYIYREQANSSKSILPSRDKPIVISDLFAKVNIIPVYTVLPENPWVNFENELDVAFETQIKKVKKKKIRKPTKVKKKTMLQKQKDEDTVMFEATQVIPGQILRTIEIPQQTLKTADSFSIFFDSLEVPQQPTNNPFNLLESPSYYDKLPLERNFNNIDNDFDLLSDLDQDSRTIRKLDFNNLDSFEFSEFDNF
jgi:hypothetical protein